MGPVEWPSGTERSRQPRYQPSQYMAHCEPALDYIGSQGSRDSHMNVT